MEIDKFVLTKVNVKTMKIHMKVCDSFAYTLHDDKGKEIHDQEDGYVPSFMPGNHYGDYLILDIDIDSGKILNWKEINPSEIEEAMKVEDR